MKRFWDKTEQVGDCLVWTAACNPYGRFNYNGTVEYAHRVAWKLYYGKWPTGFIMHSCDNPRCVARDHLNLGDAKANALDAKAKGKMGRPKALAPPTEHEVFALSNAGYSQRYIAERCGVAQSTVGLTLKRGGTRGIH
jgi:hypothetical protein